MCRLSSLIIEPIGYDLDFFLFPALSFFRIAFSLFKMLLLLNSNASHLHANILLYTALYSHNHHPFGLHCTDIVCLFDAFLHSLRWSAFART